MAHDPSNHDMPPLMLGLTATDMAEQFRRATHEAADAHLAAGYPVYGSDENGTVLAHFPDGPTVPITGPVNRSAVNAETRASLPRADNATVHYRRRS